MNIAVFLGASPGNRESYGLAAAELGRWIAAQGHTLVYGGTSGGTMGILSRAAKQAGGKVVGVVPEGVYWESKVNPAVDVCLRVPDLPARKRCMIETMDLAVVLPGGMGTLDEVSEILSLNHVHALDKKLIFLSIEGYYDTFRAMLTGFVEAGFAREEEMRNIIFADAVSQLTALVEKQ